MATQLYISVSATTAYTGDRVQLRIARYNGDGSHEAVTYPMPDACTESMDCSEDWARDLLIAAIEML